MSESGEVRVDTMGDDFGDKRGRSSFATKVLLTICVQFGVLAMISNTMMYSFSDEIIQWFNKTGWFTIILFGIGVPVVLILMLMSPSLMTQKPKCYFSLVFLTLMLSGFVSVLAVYVTGKYKSSNPQCYTANPPSTCPLAPEQVINSALYGVMLAILICLALNWCMDMETQFKLMLVIQLVLSIGSGFIFWAIFGYSIWIVFAVLGFILGIMTWMMFFLRMIFFADFLQESADDMGVEEGIDSLWVFASLLFFVQICRLFLGCVKLILVTQE